MIDLMSDLLGWLTAIFFIVVAFGLFVVFPFVWLLALMFGW